LAKKITQKNNELLLAQQKTELDKLRDTLSLDTLRAAEDKLLAQSLEIVEGSFDFASLGYDEHGELDENQLPLEWGLLSPNEKARKIRLAKYACLPSGEVPFGMKAAHAMAIGIIKARAQEKSGTKILNLEVSQFPAPAPLTQEKGAIDADFEVIDVDR
jgi:hypothetical protein